MIAIAAGIDKEGNLQLLPDAPGTPETVELTNSVSLVEARVFDTDGKQLSVAAARELLKGETPVLLTRTGRKMPPAYLQVIKKGTLIVVFPLQLGWRYLTGDVSRILNKEKYEKIKTGMTLKEVYAVLDMGPLNERLGPVPEELPPQDTVYRVRWVSDEDRWISVTLQGDKVINKSKGELFTR
jgi:hypothetical protein